VRRREKEKRGRFSPLKKRDREKRVTELRRKTHLNPSFREGRILNSKERKRPSREDCWTLEKEKRKGSLAESFPEGSGRILLIEEIGPESERYPQARRETLRRTEIIPPRLSWKDLKPPSPYGKVVSEQESPAKILEKCSMGRNKIFTFKHLEIDSPPSGRERGKGSCQGEDETRSIRVWEEGRGEHTCSILGLNSRGGAIP